MSLRWPIEVCHVFYEKLRANHYKIRVSHNSLQKYIETQNVFKFLYITGKPIDAQNLATIFDHNEVNIFIEGDLQQLSQML